MEKLMRKIRYKFRRFKLISEKYRLVTIKTLNNRLETTADYPSIAAKPNQFIDIAIEGFERSVIELNKLIGTKELDIRHFQLEKNQSLIAYAEKLKQLLDDCGSDKGSSHGYFQYYAKILFPKEKLKILEIGLGSNNLSVPSNMGFYGKPGASIRAWASLPNVGQVVGCDIDSSILFESGKIRTYTLNQTSHESWDKFEYSSRTLKFDLIIDDGLHSPLANIVTVNRCLNILEDDGVLVVEDIPERSLPYWQLYFHNLPKNLEGNIYKFRKAYLLTLKRLS